MKKIFPLMFIADICFIAIQGLIGPSYLKLVTATLETQTLAVVAFIEGIALILIGLIFESKKSQSFAYKQFLIILIGINIFFVWLAFIGICYSKLAYYVIYVIVVALIGTIIENILIGMKSNFNRPDRILFDRRKRISLAIGALFGGLMAILVKEVPLNIVLIMECVSQIIWGVLYFIAYCKINKIKK